MPIQTCNCNDLCMVIEVDNAFFLFVKLLLGILQWDVVIRDFIECFGEKGCWSPDQQLTPPTPLYPNSGNEWLLPGVRV